MRFLIDAQLPPALVECLVGWGHTATHVAEVGLRDADDLPIWNHAAQTGACLITKDEDFAGRVLLDRRGPAVIWLRVGNCTNRALLAWFEPLFPGILRRLEQGERLIEVV